ncbi:MAG: hypothetical protein CL793_07325 [Chloroflexi bacterium]|nr:hypothetical protein [Chloroflexota bacterium]|tara:strand:- start:945 stop:1295 length:351 start_codon:yes stop_codon:yes gene_type:complete
MRLSDLELTRHRERMLAMKLFGINNPCQFGEMAKFLQLVTQQQIEEAVLFQEECKDKNRSVPRIGEVLVDRGILSQSQIGIILQEQTRFGSSDVDDTLAEIDKEAKKADESLSVSR